MNKSIKNISNLRDVFSGQTIISIQPVEDSPLDKIEIIVAMAIAAEQAGARGLRIEGIKNVTAVAAQVNIPIIGIVKRDLTDSPIRITPYIEDVVQLAQAGATIIAFDCTDRIRPESRENIIKAIAYSGCISMADCSCFEDGLWAHENGVDIIGSTLSGYVGDKVPDEPDFDLVKQFAQQGFFSMAEGRFNTPELAAKAIECGAVAVTVGSALTRLEVMIDWFNQATRAQTTGKQIMSKQATRIPTISAV